MEVGIERLAGALHFFYTLAFKELDQLVVYNFHSFADCCGVFVGISGSKATFKIVNNRQNPGKYTFRCVFDKFCLLFGNTFAVVVEISHQEKIFFFFFFKCLSGIFQLVLQICVGSFCIEFGRSFCVIIVENVHYLGRILFLLCVGLKCLRFIFVVLFIAHNICYVCPIPIQIVCQRVLILASIQKYNNNTWLNVQKFRGMKAGRRKFRVR